MIVALDARMTEGIGTVIRNVAAGVAPHLERLLLLGHPDQLAQWDLRAGNVEIVPFTAPVYGWREQAGFPMARIRGCNLLHVPHFNVPIRRLPCPLVVTIHDTAHLAGALPMGGTYRVAAQLYYRHAVRRASHLLTDSNFSRRELETRLGVSRDRITVVPPGVDGTRFMPRPQEVQPVLDRLGIHAPYLLILGSVRPHKNIGMALKAFAALKQREGIPHTLVVVGRKEGFRIGTRLELPEEAVLRDVVFTGYLSDDEIVKLYSGAEIFVFPSLYEGFGLPPLEAMACGTAVAVSRAGAIPEVVGDAGAYFDATDADDIARTILSLLTDPQRRRQLADAGRARAGTFTWNRAVEGHLAVYRAYAS